MATIGGGYAVANAIAFGMPDTQTQNYYMERVNNLVSMGANSGFSQGFLDTAVKVVNSLNASNIIEKATAVINKIKGFFRPNVISRIDTITDFQIAGSVMQNYLMADPVIRELKKEQLISGYQDSYIDPFPLLSTFDHPDYRDVMTGIVQTDKDGCSYHIQYLHNRQVKDDTSENILSSEQKFCIIDSRAMLREFALAGGKDPTDQWNSDL